MWDEKCGRSSEVFPVKIFTTPPGRSEEFKTSANETAHNGFNSEAKTTQEFPPAITGMINETKPIKEFSYGTIITTTPINSKTEKLKCENKTGFTELNNA